MTEVIIDSDEKTITFMGGVYHDWRHIRWLRAQLKAIEYNAELMWGSEINAAIRALEERRAAEGAEQVDKPAVKFTVIDGGKT